MEARAPGHSPCAVVSPPSWFLCLGVGLDDSAHLFYILNLIITSSESETELLSPLKTLTGNS